MFNKIKEWLGVGGVQKVVDIDNIVDEVGINIEDLAPTPKNISEPIYTIVEKVKENPKRLLVQLRYVCFDLEEYVGVDIKTKTTFRCIRDSKSVVILIGDDGLTCTKDESEYLFTELYEVLKTFYAERLSRWQEIKQLREERQELRNRKKIQLMWEES